jgi:predicted MPP superfamily phosphohydrolase
MLHESVKDLPIVIEGIKNIQSKYGIFSILGNHDHYDDYTKVVKAFKEAEQNLLIEETRIIQINGEYKNIIGIDYPNIGRPVELIYYDQIVRAKKGYKPEAISIYLPTQMLFLHQQTWY